MLHCNSSEQFGKYIVSTIAVFSLSIFLVLSHEEKLSEMIKELEVATSDRDSLKKKYRKTGKEMERVRSEMAHAKAE